MSKYHDGDSAATQKLHNQKTQPRLACACPGCHLPRLQRLEELNADLAREVDRLRQVIKLEQEVAAA